MEKHGKWLLWLVILGLTSVIVYYTIPWPILTAGPRLVSRDFELRQRELPLSPPSVPQPVTKVVVVREVAAPVSQPALPEFIDGGSFEVRKDRWTNVYTLPSRDGEWQDKPGLPKNFFEMRELLMKRYTVHFVTFPDTNTPHQLEYLVDGEPTRHGFCPERDKHEMFFGTLGFMRYRAAGATGDRVMVHRYWTLGSVPETAKRD